MQKTEQLVLSALLSRKGNDDRIAFVGEKTQVTWLEFLRHVNGWKTTFQTKQVRRVAIYFPRVDEAAAALFGAWAAGTVAIYPANNSQEMTKALCDIDVKYFAGDFCHAQKEQCLQETVCEEPCRDCINEREPLLELFTSGSTGRPTRIIKRPSQIFSEVEDMLKTQHGASESLAADATVFSTVSAQHIYGILFYMVWPLVAGRPIYRDRIEYPETLAKLVSETSHCLVITSPAHLNRLPDGDLFSAVASRIDVLYSSGGPVSEEGVRKTKRVFGKTPYEIFGSTESGGIAWRQRTVLADDSIGNELWHVMPGVSVKVDDQGQLCIKSARLSSDGWETTADIVEFVEPTVFRHIKRADRIAKIEGKRVSLTAMEESLRASKLVKDVKVFQLDDKRQSLSVVGIPTSAGLEKIKLEGKVALVKDLKAYLLHSVERVTLPRFWRFVSSFPVNFMGKTTHALLCELFLPERPQFLIESVDEDGATVVLSVPANSPYFEGHFPDFKLLPGVAQFQWMVEIAQFLFGQSASAELFCGIRQLKFMQPIRPNSTVIVHMEFNSEKHECSFVMSANAEADIVYGKGVIAYRAAQ